MMTMTTSEDIGMDTGDYLNGKKEGFRSIERIFYLSTKQILKFL
jgi:hypothetical protein